MITSPFRLFLSWFGTLQLLFSIAPICLSSPVAESLSLDTQSIHHRSTLLDQEEENISETVAMTEKKSFDTLKETMYMANMKKRFLNEIQDGNFEFYFDDDAGLFVALPDVSTGSGSATAVKLTDINCSNFDIADQNLAHNLSETTLQSTLQFSGVAMSCVGNYEATTSLGPFTTSYSGGLEVNITDTKFKFDMLFESVDFNEYPPNEFQVTNCEAEVKVSNAELSGGLIADLLNLVSDIVKSLFEYLLETVVCDEFNKLEETINDTVSELSEDFFEPYLEEGYVPTDPLIVEQNLLSTLPDDINLVDFNDAYVDSSFFDLFLQIINNVLGASSGGISIQNLDIRGEDPFDFEIRSIKIEGFEFANFNDMFKVLGQHTLAMEVVIQNARIEIQAYVAETYNVNMEFEIRNFNATAALMVALKDDLTLGTFFNMDDLECVQSYLYSVQIAAMALDEMEVSPPNITIEEDTIFAVNLLYVAYESSLEILIKEMIKSLSEDYSGTNLIDNKSLVDPCPPPAEPNGYVDYRDLFLPPQQAKEYGASGTEPYGSLMRKFKDIIDSETTDIDPETQEPMINTHIRDMTEALEALFDKYGSIELDEVFDISMGDAGGGDEDWHIALTVTKFKFLNMDTFGNPMTTSHPVRNESYLLNTSFTLGKPSSPVTITMDVTADIQTPVVTFNGVTKWSVNFNTMQRMSTLLLMISEENLYAIPVQDFLNIWCWLGVLPAPTLDDEGYRVDGQTVPYEMTEWITEMDGFEVSVECIVCDDNSLEIVDNINENSQNIFSRRKLQETLGDFLLMEFDKLIKDAPMYCPHRAEYNPGAIPPPLFNVTPDPVESQAPTTAPVVPENPPTPEISGTKSRSIIVTLCLGAGLALLWVLF